jgi:hypothetical protein
MDSKNFVKKIDEIKRANKLDLSVGEDLSIGLMNLVSLEEHFLFSYMKTEEARYLEFLEDVREVRKRLLERIVKREDGDYGEVWCISKHLLATAMRLSEVGTKYLHDGKKKDAEEIFMVSFNMYSMFWAMNGFLDSEKSVGFEKPGKGKMSKLSEKLKSLLDCCKE